MNWYALHVHSNHERLVADKLAYEGIEAFYPHLVKRSKDGHRDVERKLIPGYVFSRFDILEKTPVIAIPQVVSILGWGRHAVPLPDSEVAAVRLIVDTPEVMVEPCAYVAEGDQVRVMRGPLRGLVGFVAYAKNSARVVVSVAMLARSISAEVDADALELVERADLRRVA